MVALKADGWPLKWGCIMCFYMYKVVPFSFLLPLFMAKRVKKINGSHSSNPTNIYDTVQLFTFICSLIQ